VDFVYIVIISIEEFLNATIVIVIGTIYRRATCSKEFGKK
tara:strand:+ start:205 stop:324 length:120 start_codon:yes stop_codon:yes gene_type:complete